MSDGTLAFDLADDVVELAPYVPSPGAAPLREITFRSDAWLPTEIDVLREMFAADAGVEDIAASLGRPIAGVQHRLYVLGLRRNTNRPWSEWEEAELLARYRRESAADIARSLGRGVSAVYARAKLLDLTAETLPPYSAWEDAQIRTGYALGVPVAQIAALIGRPMGGIATHAWRVLNVEHANHSPGWSHEEEARALALCEEGHRYLEIIEMLVDEGFPRRTKNGFGQRVRILGYGRGWGKAWSDDEDELLRRAYATGANLRRLAVQMARTAGSLKHRAEYLNLQGSHLKPDGARQGRPWSEEEDAKLRAGYGKGRVKHLAAEIGRPLSAVYNRAFALGLKSDWCRDFTAEEDAAIGVAWRNGIGLVILSEALGRQTRVVWKRAESLGLPFGSSERPVKPKGGGRRRARLTLREILALEQPARPIMNGRGTPADREARRASLRPRELRRVKRELRA